MERTFERIVWENGDKKDRIFATIVTTNEEGQTVKQQAAITQDSPDWEEALTAAGGAEALDEEWENTQKEKEERRQKREEEEKSRIERMKQEALFEVKLEIFEIEAVKNSKNRGLKSAIRKAKTQTEALCYAAACVSDQLRREDDEAAAEAAEE